MKKTFISCFIAASILAVSTSAGTSKQNATPTFVSTDTLPRGVDTMHQNKNWKDSGYNQKNKKLDSMNYPPKRDSSSRMPPE